MLGSEDGSNDGSLLGSADGSLLGSENGTEDGSLQYLVQLTAHCLVRKMVPRTVHYLV